MVWLLPVPGRADHDHVVALLSTDHRGQLGAVGRQRREEVRGIDPAVDLLGMRHPRRARHHEGLVGLVDQVAHEAVRPKLVRSIDEVLPHEVLREGEGRERDFLHHLEARHVAYQPTDALEDAGHVEAGLVAGQLAFEVVRGDPLFGELLQERQVEAHLVALMA